MRQKEEEIIIGTISALKILLSYPTSGLFEDKEFCTLYEYVLSKKDSTLPI